MRLVTDEIFGPVTAVMRAEHFDDAIELANAPEYRLSAAISPKASTMRLPPPRRPRRACPT
jgi:acyl-CoA reductase-like NAD-dependent aldehyde dehydrogenase